MSIEVIPPKEGKVLDPDGSFSQIWYRWFFEIKSLFKSGYTGTITTAKLTALGANGTMTFVSGVLVSQTAAT